jgi:hypothetical protein
VDVVIEPTVLWRSGDAWRDLGPALDGVDAVTVISRSGTARFLDLAGGRHNRLSLEGGHVMWLDSQWRPLDSGSGPGGWGLAITPCGLNVLGGFDWAMGTPLWAVLDGLWSAAPAIGGIAEWTATALGREILDAIVAGERPVYGPGHPDDACGAAYCEKARASR